ncbi:MAG: hypothetical protein JWR80_6717 [Bradyrhizobium sp.]|nr:hypothetical protein [Bradyrhizobium sp.]
MVIGGQARLCLVKRREHRQRSWNLPAAAWAREARCRDPGATGTDEADKGSASSDAIRGASSPPNRSLTLSLNSFNFATGPHRPQGRRGPTIFFGGTSAQRHRRSYWPPNKIVTPTAADAVATRSLTPLLGARAEGMTSFKKRRLKMTAIRFTDIAAFLADETAEPSDRFATAFTETADQVRLARTDDAITADMPDPLQMQLGVEMLVTTLFDLLRDTRLESVAERLAWGIVHSFHKVAGGLDAEADRAAQQVGAMIRENDGGEIAATELEEAQTLCHGLDEAREAVAAMRDHAAQMFQAETGRPWSSPRATLVSGKRTASVIAATDFLAARRQRRIDAHAPKGPVVVFSGGQQWADYQQIWTRLEEIRARVPAMVLATTGQDKGCDAIAAAWAARSGVTMIAFTLDRRYGNRAGFLRNEQLVKLQPVEAMVCEGSGLQAHLARALRAVGVPSHFLTLAGQATKAA